jgi:ankyrin repeat protein
MSLCMTLFHVYFALHDKQAFQRLLNTSSDRAQSLGVSGVGKSWNRTSSSMSCNLNDRDALGRTVLHIACSSVKVSDMDYVELLLGHPSINVNIQDMESHWTALHRALYNGNIAAA